MKILLVPPSEIEQAWKIALPILRRANTPGEEMDENEVYHDLQQGIQQLWLGENGAFACITQIRQSTIRKYALIYMLAGTGIKSWYCDLFLYLYSWARAQGAVTLEIEYPRKGWRRLLAGLGFTPFDEDTLIKEIA